MKKPHSFILQYDIQAKLPRDFIALQKIQERYCSVICNPLITVTELKYLKANWDGSAVFKVLFSRRNTIDN